MWISIVISSGAISAGAQCGVPQKKATVIEDNKEGPQTPSPGAPPKSTSLSKYYVFSSISMK